MWALHMFYLSVMIPLYVCSLFPVLSDPDSIQSFSTIHAVQWTYLRVLYTSCAAASFLLVLARLITALLRTITAHVL